MTRPIVSSEAPGQPDALAERHTRVTCFRSAAAACALALAATACSTEPPITGSEPRTTTSAHPTTTSPASESRVTSVRSDLLVSGTIFWGRFLEDWSDASPLGVQYPFQRLGDFDPDRYDAWIAGLECPTVGGDSMDAQEQDRLLSFNCDPRFLPEAARWFDAVSLANNHTDNRGRQGVAETRRRLEKFGIRAFGDPDPSRLDHLCRVVPVVTHVRHDDGTETEGRLPIALCGLHAVFQVPSAEAVAEIGRYAARLPTFVLPHGGLEYVAHPDSIKVDLARRVIDAGADAVLGDHPHWVQPAEAWHGRLIVHSLGNFMFDQQNDLERTRAASISVRITSSGRDLDDWLALGEQCATGDCWPAVEAAGLPKLRANLRYGVVASVNSDRVTRPATSAEEAGVLDRLDWRHAMEGLNGRTSSVRR